MAMTIRPFIQALHGTAMEIPPLWLMRQAGRYLPEYRAVREKCGGFLDLCYSPAEAAEVTLQPIRRYGFDAAILFSDILVVPDAMGAGVRFVEGEGPKTTPIGTKAELEALRDDPDAMLQHLRPVYEAAARTRAALPDETALIGFAGAPWTVATYMVEGGSSRDFLRVKGLAATDPAFMDALIGVLEDLTYHHLNAQIGAGADAVQIFDSWAGALPETWFARWSAGPLLRLAERLKQAHPDLPVILFPRQAGAGYLELARHEAVDCVSLDSAMPIGWARDNLGGHAVIQGNMDPVFLLAGGDALTEEARRIVGGLRGTPHIFNLGHGVHKDTNPENVARLVSAVRQTATGNS